MQPKDLYFQGSKKEIDLTKTRFYQLLEVCVTDFDLCIEWDLFIET